MKSSKWSPETMLVFLPMMLSVCDGYGGWVPDTISISPNVLFTVVANQFSAKQLRELLRGVVDGVKW